MATMSYNSLELTVLEARRTGEFIISLNLSQNAVSENGESKYTRTKCGKYRYSH